MYLLARRELRLMRRSRLSLFDFICNFTPFKKDGTKQWDVSKIKKIYIIDI